MKATRKLSTSRDVHDSLLVQHFLQANWTSPSLQFVGPKNIIQLRVELRNFFPRESVKQQQQQKHQFS